MGTLLHIPPLENCSLSILIQLLPGFLIFFRLDNKHDFFIKYWAPSVQLHALSFSIGKTRVPYVLITFSPIQWVLSVLSPEGQEHVPCDHSAHAVKEKECSLLLVLKNFLPVFILGHCFIPPQDPLDCQEDSPNNSQWKFSWKIEQKHIFILTTIREKSS